MAFADTENKRTVRRVYDLSILRNWQMKVGRKLTYLGLPGPEIHDLIDWKDILDRRRTGVESPGSTRKVREEALETIGRLKMNVLVNTQISSSGFELLLADIEDVIINGIDSRGTQPCMSDKGEAHLAKFAYDFVNLDFDGGLGHANKKGEAKRVDAIKKLFERQQGTSFLFILTINFRHNLKYHKPMGDGANDEFSKYLVEMRTLKRGIGWQEMIDWYLNKGVGELEYKLKATVPSFIQAVSEPRMFKCKCYPPVFYIGHQQARMIHFIFEMESQPGNLKGFSPQDDRNLIALPLLRCESGNLIFASTQTPDFDLTKSMELLSFLPENIRENILQSAGSVLNSRTRA